MAGPEADPEGLGLRLDLEVLELGGHGGPALLADGHVEAPQDLSFAEADPAQLAAIEHEPQRPRAQRHREIRAPRGRQLPGVASLPGPSSITRAETYQEGGTVVQGTLPPAFPYESLV